MVSFSSRGRKLEAAANALIRNDRDPQRLARPRTGKSVAVSDREFQHRRKLEKLRAARVTAHETFRNLPKPIRSAITTRFKAERAKGSTENWNDWLARQLEIIDGMQVQ